jgi:hypothetical protein
MRRTSGVDWAAGVISVTARLLDALAHLLNSARSADIQSLFPEFLAYYEMEVASSANYGKIIALDSANNALVAGSDLLAQMIVTVRYDAGGNQLWQRVFDNPGTFSQGG